ncbi:class I SAM-dependent methyltransferase [Shewanella surugensis]|uniref:Class I SAM-dependent methyltransferase n=1 Tax=Shewanella surugensis TaxID=212020 RepID=A0ABT0LDL1_9GAMM|nr:class I SAM-dependent methyltransferase [Shewanella surugensis]MCL1125783.1 class I SAM-dependent methyltransferase [Shewanella surugensis]
MTFKMNSPQGKCILAMVREGDFAHPGEELAIIDAVMGLPKEKINNVLDLGCGRGGTANWFHSNDWGKLVGVDIDEVSIQYAKRQYPDVLFYSLDVLSLTDIGRDNFDLIYLFNVFYSLSDQQQSLKMIRQQCQRGAHLLICDYTLKKEQLLPKSLGSEIGQPIALDTISSWLAQSHWQLIRLEDWTGNYIKAYIHFIAKLASKREAIISLFDEAWYQYTLTWYQTLLMALEAGQIGGGKFIIRAV